MFCASNRQKGGGILNSSADSYRSFLSGNTDGLTQIISVYREGLILYLNTLVRDIHLAEDLTEETFVKLIIKKPRLKDDTAFKTWLYTIAGNVARDYLRSKRLKETPLEDHPYLQDELDLEQSYLKKQHKILLHRAMEKLKPEYRQVLWLVYFEEYSNKEAAHILKKTVHSTEVLVSRARKALKQKLLQEGYLYEEQ